ncbi:MAG: cytochrome c oxidase accessory protein CcoG [Polyangiales bacterium]
MKSSIRHDGSRATVHPADVSGRFTRARRAVFAVLLALYLVTPWITLGGNPAVLLDLPGRRFYLFGRHFNAQDGFLLFFLLTGIGVTLYLVTTILGRVWCGWGCPQTVFLEAVFRPIQRLIEGSREARMRREAKPWTFDRTWRRVLLWTVYLAISSVLAHSLLGYFFPVRTLVSMVLGGPGAHPEAFLAVTIATGLIFFDVAWFREQLCLAICPYGRLQSVMTDPDTLVVGYDEKRGEPRGKAKSEGVGDCVDCNRCVVVCPTGIDIRNGLQLDCIACTQCIDACDEVMDKLHRPRGLIRYDSLRGLAHETRRFLRPRLFIYAAVIALWVVGLSLTVRSRVPFEANLLRLQGAPYTLENGTVRNSFNIHLVNKRDAATTFRVSPEQQAPGLEYLIPLRSVTLAPLAGTNLPIFVTMPRGSFHGDTPLRIRVATEGAGSESRVVTAPFLGPAN